MRDDEVEEVMEERSSSASSDYDYYTNENSRMFYFADSRKSSSSSPPPPPPPMMASSAFSSPLLPHSMISSRRGSRRVSYQSEDSELYSDSSIPSMLQSPFMTRKNSRSNSYVLPNTRRRPRFDSSGSVSSLEGGRSRLNSSNEISTPSSNRKQQPSDGAGKSSSVSSSSSYYSSAGRG